LSAYIKLTINNAMCANIILFKSNYFSVSWIYFSNGFNTFVKVLKLKL